MTIGQMIQLLLGSAFLRYAVADVCDNLTTEYGNIAARSAYTDTNVKQKMNINSSLAVDSSHCWSVIGSYADHVVGVYVISAPVVGNTSLIREKPLQRECTPTGSVLRLVDGDSDRILYEICADLHDGRGPFYSLSTSIKLEFITGTAADSIVIDIYKQRRVDVDLGYFRRWDEDERFPLVVRITVGLGSTAILLAMVWFIIRAVQKRRALEKDREEEEERRKYRHYSHNRVHQEPEIEA